MNPVRCSWVDMQKLRAALSSDEPGTQKALQHTRCVDKATVSKWKAICDLLDAISNSHEVDICKPDSLETFQPSHAAELVRHLRKTAGKDRKKWDAEVIAGWIGKVEEDELTVEQFKVALADDRAKPPGDDAPRCTANDLQTLIDSGTRFGCVYADPPWKYDNSATRGETGNHYGTMSLDAIAALPVGKLAAAKSHLWLWTTNGFLFECPRLFAAWGFEFKSSYVWVKPQMGVGNYLRNSHEFLLLAVRGGLTAEARDVMSWGRFDRGEHSAKPEEIRTQVVERVSPGPRLELFGRKPVAGWSVWGNQVSREAMEAAS